MGFGYNRAITTFSYKLIYDHFRLLSSLVSDSGVVHFALTDVVYHLQNRQINFESPLIDYDILKELINTCFEVEETHEKWIWFRETPSLSLQIIAFNCTSVTLRPKPNRVERLKY